MGTLRSTSNLSGQHIEVNDVTLGEPTGTYTEDGQLVPPYLYDDPRLPNGVVSDTGVVVLDDQETDL
jgi:hypothetical protein